MNERWVCKRCYADNDGPASACVRCGLLRGAEATDADRATWAAAVGAPPPATNSPSWQRYLRFWWIPALVVALGVGYLTTAKRDSAGSITDSGSLQIQDVRIGDCFDVGDEEEVSEVAAGPCTDPHGYEMFHLATWSGADAYPTDDAMLDFIIQACVPVFEEYVGMSYETSVIDFVPFTPTEEGWNDGDRVVQCALVDPGNERLTASLRNANR
ncbi:MAG TPA: septum formation family protein [Candidatus Limnocylindria bacterium]|nr:septum formation family protein [Candidatus Limnocylindria bacterium]